MRPVIAILAAAAILGCNPQSDPGIAPPTVAREPTMPTLAAFDNAPILTEASLQALERKYSCELPLDYRKFLLANNGGFPSPDCVTFDEAGRKTASDVFCFFAIGDQRAGISMEWHLEQLGSRLSKDSLPIARDSCGNVWLLGVAGNHAGSVFFWDHGSYDTFDETELANLPRVAASFSAFRNQIRTYDPAVENCLVPSRYSLVRQAVQGMTQRDPSFSTRALPEFVWHCDCDDEGAVSMVAVQYPIHAITTHTDGYSRLRALKGLIKQGKPRLPH